MSIALPTHRSEPLAELNTTPLIDVMLVLLIMLIFTLPPLTNSLDFDLPKPGPGFPSNPVSNTVTVTAGDRITWNGQAVSEAQLEGSLGRAMALKPEPQLLFAPDAEASYNESARVLRLIKLSGATNVGFVGNERYRTFGR